MRVVGCVLIFLWITMLGFSRKCKLEQNCEQWKSMLLFIQLLQEELQGSMGSTEQIINAASECCKPLVLLQNYQKVKGTVQERLYHAAEMLSDNRMRELSLRLSRRLGRVSADIQLDSLHTMEQQCEQELKRARETADKEASLTVSLSVLTGAAAAIFLL